MKRIRHFPITTLFLLYTFHLSTVALSFPAPPAQAQGVRSSTEATQPDPEAERRSRIAELMQPVFQTEYLRQKQSINKQILEIDPYHAAAVQGLIEVQARIKEEKKARTKEQETQQSKQGAIEKARQAYLAGDLDTAEKWIGTALAIDSSDPEALALREHLASDRRSRQTQRTVLWVVAAVLVIGLGAFLVIRLRKSGGILEVSEGDESGRLIALDGETTVLGSLEAEVDHVIYCPSRRISRRHCSILKSGKHYFLTDHSTNGTFVNGRPVGRGQPVLLLAGDMISLAGDVSLRFRFK